MKKRKGKVKRKKKKENDKTVLQADNDVNPIFFSLIGKKSNEYPDEKYEKELIKAKGKGCTLNEQSVSKKGNTALMVSLKNKQYSKASLLIKHGAIWDKSNKQGQKPDNIIRDQQISENIIRQIKSGSFKKP